MHLALRKSRTRTNILPFLLGLIHPFMHSLPIPLHGIIGYYVCVDKFFSITIDPNAYIPKQSKHTKEESFNLFAIR